MILAHFIVNMKILIF